jgi:uncharacterized damage-inducible protein DinB
MISTAFARSMARYNQWQNAALYTAADALGDAARRLERGAFFGSIHGTFNHLVWGDSIWMHRFAGTPKPAGGIKDSPARIPGWDQLKAERAALDRAILDWADGLDEEWLSGTMTWFSATTGREVSKPHWFLVQHFYNHQTHHRGQIHAMLTAAGAKLGDTDLFLLENPVF